MGFEERVAQHADRVKNLTSTIKTEEAAKTSLVMPFFQLLGYDIFNPQEFIPEFTADVGTKKGEKVDYAIIIDEKPLILVECKALGEDLSRHTCQLFRYFSTVPEAKFGIVTNGVVYRFFTDFNRANILDERPFWEFSLLDLKDSNIDELRKFRRERLDIDNILNSAEALKYSGLINSWIAEQFQNPSDNLIRLILNDVYSGVRTARVIDNFRPLVASSLEEFQNDQLKARFKLAIENTSKGEIDDASPDECEDNSEVEEEVQITLDGIEGFAIVKAILHTVCDVDRLTIRRTQSYYVVDYDGNSWKRVVRLWLNRKTKFITVPDEDMQPVRLDIDGLNDIYTHSDRIIEACKRYVDEETL